MLVRIEANQHRMHMQHSAAAQCNHNHNHQWCHYHQRLFLMRACHTATVLVQAAQHKLLWRPRPHRPLQRRLMAQTQPQPPPAVWLQRALTSQPLPVHHHHQQQQHHWRALLLDKTAAAVLQMQTRARSQP